MTWSMSPHFVGGSHYQHFDNDTMTHFDLGNAAIKTEPMSPNSIEELWQDITPPSTAHSSTVMSTNQPATPSSASQSNSFSPCSTNFQNTAGNGSGGVSQSTLPTVQTSDMRTALKSSILKKRKARGETSLPSMEDEPREHKLTRREIQKKEARKEQNRRAAKKCRMKKKMKEREASQEMVQARKENVEMLDEVRSLRQQVCQLQKIISDHEKSQNCKLAPLHPSCISKTHTNVCQTKFNKGKSSPCLHSPEVAVTVNTVSPTSLPVLFHQSHTQPCPSTDTQAQNFVETCSDILSSTHREIEPLDYYHLLNNSVNSYDSNNNTMQHEPITSNFPSWDLNNLTSDLPADQEVSANLKEIIDNLGENIYIDFETPKVDGVENKRDNPVFSCISNDETPKTCVLSKSTDSKPPVVRNLNRYFLQNDYLSDGNQKQQHQPDTMAHLLDNSLSSPILSCVSPNLVQQPFPISKTSPGESSPSQHVITNSVNQTPFEHLAISQSIVNQWHCETSDPNDFTSRSLTDMSTLPNIQLQSTESFEDNQPTAMSFQSFISKSRSIPVPPPEATITECCGTDVSNNDNDISDAHSSGSSGFNYQLSPISLSSSSSISSPDFLQPSPHNLCDNHYSPSVFDFDFVQ